MSYKLPFETEEYRNPEIARKIIEMDVLDPVESVSWVIRVIDDPLTEKPFDSDPNSNTNYQHGNFREWDPTNYALAQKYLKIKYVPPFLFIDWQKILKPSNNKYIINTDEKAVAIEFVTAHVAASRENEKFGLGRGLVVVSILTHGGIEAETSGSGLIARIGKQLITEGNISAFGEVAYPGSNEALEKIKRATGDINTRATENISEKSNIYGGQTFQVLNGIETLNVQIPQYVATAIETMAELDKKDELRGHYEKIYQQIVFGNLPLDID